LGDPGCLPNSLFVAHRPKAVIKVVSTSMQVVENEEGCSFSESNVKYSIFYLLAIKYCISVTILVNK